MKPYLLACLLLLCGTVFCFPGHTGHLVDTVEDRDPTEREARVFRVKDTEPSKNRPLFLSRPIAVLQKLRKPSDILQDHWLPSLKIIPSIFTGLKPSANPKPVATTPKPYADKPQKPIDASSSKPQAQYKPDDYYPAVDPYYNYLYPDSVYNSGPYYDNYNAAELLAVPIPSESSGKSDWILDLIRNSTVLGTIKL